MYRLDSAKIRHWPAATLVVTLTAGWHRRECEKNVQERESMQTFQTKVVAGNGCLLQMNLAA